MMPIMSEPSPMALQQTLKNAIHCTGVGLHSGKSVTMRLHPAPAGTGISFVRTDLDRGTVIPARWDNVVDTRLCTVVGTADGTTVGTVEHLMAALAGCGIDNAVVELDGPEVPIMDGSSAPFVFLIDCAGTQVQNRPRRLLRILKTVCVEDGAKSALLSPSPVPICSFEIEFDSAAVRRQVGHVHLDPSGFKRELARARTFGFLHEVDLMRRNGLARGGSLDNAVVISGDRVLNEGGLRFRDEFVRHKMLDSVGDLYLAGGPILGHFHGVRSGHALNNRLLHTLFADPESHAWEEENEEMWPARLAASA
jgi:UDP-3-O-[3-hydroxymyristoyl] N-acetylglucosamine deacetylase